MLLRESLEMLDEAASHLLLGGRSAGLAEFLRNEAGVNLRHEIAEKMDVSR